MPSIASLTGSTSSTSSIYGNRTTNIISGLASGLDTEAMIEGLVQSYQQKITGLQQDRTKLQWQQSAYQSISDKLVEFSRKYTSYTSSTNLLSQSFFNNAVVTTTNGTYADLVSASGKTSSNVSINAVAQLATAARYTVSNQLGAQASGGKITASGGQVTLGKETTISTMDGSLTLTYGSQQVTLDFGELELFAKDDDSGLVDMKKLSDAINEKLSEQEVSINGTMYTADQLIKVEFNDKGTISLTDGLNAGNSVYISGASGNFADRISGLNSAVANKESSFGIDINRAATEKVNTADYLADKTMTVTLNGQTKTIKLDGMPQDSDNFAGDFVDILNEKLNDAFGSGKITASLTKEGALAFTADSGNTFSVTSNAGELLGMDDGALTSYLDTSKTLGSLLNNMEGMTAIGKDSEGRDLYSLNINGVEIGPFTKDTALETVINRINSNTEAGVNVSYSQLTNQFVFTAKETGEGGRIEIGETVQDKDGGTSTNLAAQLLGQWTRRPRGPVIRRARTLSSRPPSTAASRWSTPAAPIPLT